MRYIIHRRVFRRSGLGLTFAHAFSTECYLFCSHSLQNWNPESLSIDLLMKINEFEGGVWNKSRTIDGAQTHKHKGPWINTFKNIPSLFSPNKIANILRHKNVRHHTTLMVVSPPGFTTSFECYALQSPLKPFHCWDENLLLSCLPSTLLPCWPRLLPESLDREKRGHGRSIKLSHRSLFPLLSPSKLPVAPHQWPVWQPGAQEHWGGRNVRYISTLWRKTTGAVGHDIWGRPLFRRELFEDRK